MRLTRDIRSSITEIHAVPARLVFAFAGAGSLAPAWLHAVPGSSRTVLAGWDAYAPRALALCVEPALTPPYRAVSAPVALELARWAHRQAVLLAESDGAFLGVGVTAALRTDRVRRGCDQAFIAVSDGRTLHVRQLVMGRPGRSRAQQEALIARLVIAEIAAACGCAVPAVPLAEADLLETVLTDSDDRRS